MKKLYNSIAEFINWCKPFVFTAMLGVMLGMAQHINKLEYENTQLRISRNLCDTINKTNHIRLKVVEQQEPIQINITIDKK